MTNPIEGLLAGNVEPKVVCYAVAGETAEGRQPLNILNNNGPSVDTDASVTLGSVSAPDLAPTVNALQRTLHLRPGGNLVWDGQLSNTGLIVLASAARTSTTTSSTLDNPNKTGVHLITNITAVPGGDTIQVILECRDQTITNLFYTVATSPFYIATGLNVIKLFPGANEIANLKFNDMLSREFRVRVIHSGAGSFTYSIAALLIG